MKHVDCPIDAAITVEASQSIEDLEATAAASNAEMVITNLWDAVGTNRFNRSGKSRDVRGNRERILEIIIVGV